MTTLDFRPRRRSQATHTFTLPGSLGARELQRLAHAFSVLCSPEAFGGMADWQAAAYDALTGLLRADRARALLERAERSARLPDARGFARGSRMEAGRTEALSATVVDALEAAARAGFQIIGKGTTHIASGTRPLTAPQSLPGVLPTDDVLRNQYRLTARELEVARALIGSESVSHLAVRFGISVHTMRRHTEQIYRKLGVNSRRTLTDRLIGQRSA